MSEELTIQQSLRMWSGSTLDKAHRELGEKAADLIDDLELIVEMNTRAEGWVSVEDRLPEDEEYVDVWLSEPFDMREPDVHFWAGKFRLNSAPYITFWKSITPPTE